MPLAGHREVLAALQDQPYGPAREPRAEGAHRGPGRGLVLLAAERAAEPSHVDLHRMHGHPEHARHVLLHPRGRLRRRVHEHRAVLDRLGERALGLEVEVLLRARVGPTAHDVRAARPGRIDVAQREGARGHEQVASRRGLARVEDGRARLDLERDRAAGPPGGASAVGQHHGHRLPHVVHRALGQQGLVGQDAADLVLAGNVGRGEHAHHAGLA